MPDNRYYYFKDAKGNRHTVNKAAFDNDREGFAKAFPGARMEVIDRKTGRRGDVDVKDAGRVGDFGAHLFTGQTVRREKYQPKTSLGKAAQSVAQEKWGGKESELVKGLREADALKRRDEEQMPIDYTKPSAVKQMVGRTRREQQTLDRRIEQAGREAGKEVQGEIRRKNSPAFDLGNENVNNNLVKTRGQLEKEMEKSGSKLVDDEFSKYISDVFKKEDEAAFERGQNAALNVIASSPSNAIFNTTRARNEEMSPEKRLANITKEIEGNIHNLFSSSNVAERIKAEATKLGVSPDDYVEHTLVPSLMNKVSSDFDKTELKSLLPSGAIETILMHTQNSMTGALASMGLMTKSQRQYGQRALSETLEGNNPKYNPGLGTRVAGSTLSFMMDMTPIGMAEKPAAALAGKLFGNGVAQTARIANSTLGGRIARMAGSGMVSQGITGVLYGSTNAAVQNYSTGDDTSIGNTVKVMAMGGLSEGASWATMGGIGGAVGAGIYNVSGVKRIPAKAFQLAMEGIGMHMGGNVAKTIEGHDTDWTSIEGNLEACANVVALKLTHARLPKRQVKDGVKESYLDMVARNINGLMTSDGQRAAFGGYTFTNEEKEQLFGSASAPKRNESIYGYDAHDNPLTRKESLTSWAMRTKKTAAKGKGEESYKDTDAEFVKTAYDEIMADNTIPWDTKAKFSALVMGTVPSARPMMENCRIEGGSVNEYSKNGELLSKNSFKSIDERNSIIYSLNMKREDQRLSNAYGAAQIKDEKTAQATLEAVAEANGMTAEQLKTAMDKQPLRRSEEEQNACVALRKAYEDEQFVPGTLHAEQSNTEGKDVVEENGLGTETPNNEAVAKVLGDLTKTEDALQAAMDSNDVLKEEYERMQKAGMSNPQIYMELFNSGLTQEQLAPLADYINALSKAQGMFKGTQDKIVETTQKHVGQWSYKGELNGEKQNGEQMVFVKDNKGRVLIVGAGDVAFDGEGRVRDGDMLTVYDPATREMDFVHAKDVTLERTTSSEEYAKDYQRQLEELNSTVYAEMQQQDGKPNEASLSQTKPGEQPKGKAPKPEGEEAKSDTDMYKPGTDPLLFTVEKNGRAEQYDVTPHIKVNNEGGKIITFSGVTTFVKGAPKGHNEGETRNRPNGVAFIRINPDNIDYERYVYEDAKEQDGTPMKKEDVTEEDIAEAKEDIDFIFNRAGTGPVYNILKIIVTPDGRVYGETVDGYVVPLKKNPLESSDKYKESLNKKPVPTFADGTPVPMIKDSKNRETADYSQMSPEQGAEWMSSQFGENAEAAVDGQIKRAEKTLKGAEKIKVDYTGDLNDANEAEAQKKIAIEAAKAELELYTNIKKAMTEKKVKAGMEKASSVGGVGEVGRVGVAREKFESGLRVVGNKRTRTLADGSKLRGHYEIVDADSLTPSHNANDGYKKSEGFPVNEEGRTINDRDYENDKQAQLVTDMIAMKYDGQAVDQVPVVTSDGIVVDGNGRTMAGQKAAKNGTDSAYLEALKENAENYGFTAEQIEQSGIKHPRLVLVSDEPMKYDTATFAKFNKNEKKAQGNTQQAVANSKKLSADEIGTIISEIEGSGSLDAFFNNPSAINSLLTRLVDKGVIGLNEVAGLREGEDKLSAAGKDFVKNLLLGSVFSENTIRMMGADAMLKTKALNGIRAVTDNMKLGDYALMKEIDQAVQLLYEARQGGSGVDAYLRTPAMFGENAADRFDPISQAIALALEGKAEDFRELMMAYNRNAAPYADASQTEMFGERPTKEDFVNEFLKLRNWKNYETRHSSKEGNGDAGSSEGTEPQARGGSEPTEGQREVDKAIKRIATEITKQTGIEVVTDEKEAEEVLRNADSGEGSDVKFHKVTDQAELDMLNNEDTFPMYSGMQIIDGKLYSPMAAIIDGKRTDSVEMGDWHRADERPDLVKDDGTFVLVKTDKKKGAGEGDVPAAYNPYMHTSTSMMNDQFTGAYARGNIRVVEWSIPKSELDSGYHAEKAKDSVGMVPWHSGSVNGLLPKERQRNVMLSRWRKAIRVVPDSEVAEKVAKQLEGTDLAIPWNTFTPNQIREFAKLGVPITIKETGSVGKKTKDAFMKQKAELEKEFPQAKFVDVKMTKDAYLKWGKNEEIKASIKEQKKAERKVKKAVKEFRTKDGEVYGFTDGEKIYLDTKKMKPETPLHEYAHLWCDMLRRVNPKEWENVKKLFDKVDGLKDEVQKLYPELEGDALYEEMITTYSGREGTKKLEDVVRKLAAEEGKSVTESAKAQGFLEKVKEALTKYWKGVADVLGIHFTTAEEVADKVLADWAKGVDPRESEEGKGKSEESDTKVEGNEPSEASLGLTEPGEQPGEKSEGAKPVGDGKEPKANPLDGMRKAAELFKDEQITKVRAELAEAKKSGDASEVKRLTDKLKGLMDSTLRGKGIGLVERRKIIGEELGKAEAEKIDKPWEQMDLEEREAVSSKNPLTETEINELTSEENRELIPAALAYLRGDKGNIINAISYFKIWNDVRSRHENVPDNSGAKDGTQLDAPDTGGSQELGLGGGREGGRPDGPVDRTDGERTTPGERERGTSGENNPSVSAGKPSNDKGEGNTPGMDAVSAGSTDTRGGSRLGNEGNLPKRGGQGGGNRPLDPNAGRKPAAKQGTHFPDSTSERLKQERAEYEQKKKDFWERWKKAGQGYMKISLTPFKALNLSPEQIEMLPELFKMHLNGAVLKIKEGIYKFNEWKAAMRAEEGEELKMIGLSDDDIDRFIEDYWNTPYQMDGETHTIGEWAGIHGNEKLRNKLSEPLNDKYQRQVDAEPIKVKIGDKKNIEETLPYLLPQQQEDVLRAETQFFGNEHADREHAYGKGYMFTNGTGTGKTFTGLGVAKRLVKQGKGRILIVTPSQKKVSDWIKDGHNLNMEIRDLDSIAKERGTTATTESGEGVVITTFANFGVNKKLLETKWDAVIYDESHRIMENKNGTETARSMQHYMVTNRSENHCFLRLQETNKDYQKMKSLGERFDAERDKEVKRIQDEYKASHPSATPRDVAYATSRMLPKERNGFTPGDYASFPKLGKIHAEFVKALSHYTNEVEPKLKAQAKNEWKDTKTIFLSATPFNTRENLDYAEGYIFKYPEVEKGGRISGRTQFYLDHFGAAYKFRYNRLEQSTSNPEAVAKQEIEFSDYLQHTLGTMSGRIIDSPYDYSRDFPTVSPDHAEEFNQAVQDAVRGHGVLADAYRRTIGDYNYGSALFETMKVANIIERIKAHLDAGRKVVIFHRRVETKEPLKPPFASMLEQANRSIALMKPGEEKKKAIQAVKDFRKKYADLLEWEQTLDYSMPREQIAKVFGKDKVLFFSGKESTKAKDKAVDTFNSDDNGKNIIVIQEASGKEGISLHDTTGKHQRVCITLALPQSPITALQIEGRTYRIGNKSNAIFEYPILGLNSEMMLFGQKFNNQVSTTENLALGSKARSLRDSFANGILEHSGVVPIDQQGVGGKEFDAPKDQSTDGFDNAVLDYYSNQKLNSRNREGVDYFPTPEPLGYKMMEWANMGEGDTVLEPSAGHGAIARYAPKGNQMVAIEPSQSLFTKLQLKAGGLGRKFQNTIFENYDISNKHDVVVMNPPFGTAGATAIAHLGKAFKHLEEGGRVVALIPRGSTDKKFDKWIEGEKTAVMRAEVELPDIVFEQAGTKVVCRVVVVDKISNKAMRAKAGRVEKWDLGGHYDKIEDFFEDLRDVEMPDRIIDTKAIMMKKSKQTVKDLKELKDARVDFNEGGINVRVRGDWKDYSIPFDMEGYNAEQKKKFLASTYETFEQQERQTRNETSQAVLAELKKLTCKLADMTEEEMQRYLKKKYEGKGVMYRIEHAAEVYNKAKGDASLGLSKPTEPLEGRIAETVEKVSKQTGGKVKMVNSVEEIGNEQVRRDIENGKQVTGWYDENTGEVHLYMPNIHDSYTAEKTVWHETVGHEGMRGLLGDKFKDYMRGLWMDLDNPVNAELRAYVKERMDKDSMGFYDAIEEFIAESAEKGKGEPGFWNYIKNKVTDTLHEIGYRISPNVKDVKYMLWLAKNVQKKGNDPWWKMRADAVKWKIEHENVEYTKIHGGEFYENDGKNHDFEDMTKEEWDEATDGQIHYRTAPSAATALDRYHSMLNAHGYMATESFMDNMLSLDKLMKAVDPSIKKIEDVKSSMNPYVLQNTMQGAMSDKMTLFEHQVMKPLDKAMSDVLDSFVGKNTEEKIRECNLYMIGKHGLERNRVLFVRDKIREKRKVKSEESDSIDALEAAWNGEKNDLGQKLRSGQIDLREYYRQMDEWIVQNIDKDFKAEEHDYSGMHGLQEIDDLKSPYDDAGAIDSVMSQEAKMENQKKGSVDNLWNRIKDATNYSINSDYENGLMSEELRDRVASMFDWYVPLRKFDEATAEDVYGYISGEDGKGFIGETLMNAKGRKSLSDVNVLAQIGAMANRAIRNGGQNAVKQAFARFVRNSGEQNLVKETKVWVEKKGTDMNGNDIWEEAYPQIPDNASAHDIATIVDAFETDMKTKQAKGEAKTLSNSTDIGFKFARAKNKSEHFVDVKIAGRTHRFVVLGNPRAAQALNGMLENSSPNSYAMKKLKAATRFMAQMATSYAPEFVMRNIIRDAEMVSSNVTAKEGTRYGLKWARYYAELNPLNVFYNEGAGALKSLKWKDLKEGVGIGLYARYREGTLGNSKMERYFKEFMQNGGETGWVQVKTMQEWEKEYKRDVSREHSKVAKTGKALRDFLVGNVENLNEVAENMARFATFCTSRDLGRSAVRSAYDAKQVSTNFNRHGSGDAIKTFKNGEMGAGKEMRRNVYGFIASYLRNYSMFFNAGVQSTHLLMNNVKKAPVGTIASMMAMPFGLGILAAAVNNAMIASEDEKKRKGVKDPYGELPEYIRRNNLCIYKGGGEFVTIPLAIELRAFYGLGDIAAGMTTAKNVKSTRNVAMDAVGCMSQLLPVVDFMNSATFDKEPGKELLKGVLPTAAAPFVEWWLNSDWKGTPIRREGDYTENRPAWMNAYSGTPEKLMDLNKWVNARTNDVAPGNENMRGNSLLDEATDPAMLNHIIGTLGGGAATFITRGTGLVLKYADGREQEIETKDIPFLRSLMYTPSEQTSMARTKAKWYGYKESMEKGTSNYSMLKNKNVPLTERIRNAADRYRFEQSADYARIRIIKDAEKQMKRWNKMKRLNADDKKQVDFANKNIEMIMQKAVEQMDGISDD